jgi:hypothetical protein
MAEVHSPLCTDLAPTSKHSPRLGVTPDRFTIHHWASTSLASAVYTLATDPKRAASVNYLTQNLKIVGSVSDDRRAWTSGNAAYDRHAITIEVGNSTGGPGWLISDETFETTARLMAERANFYKMPPLTRGWRAGGVIGHREVPGASTSCPGPYLFPRLAALTARAQTLRIQLKEEEIMPLTAADVTRIWSALVGSKENNTRQTLAQATNNTWALARNLTAAVARIQTQLADIQARLDQK